MVEYLAAARALVIGTILCYVWYVGKRPANVAPPAGRRFILAGMVLVFAGSVVDIPLYSEHVSRAFTVGERWGQIAVAHGLGYFFGLVLLAIGVRQWLPGVVSAREAERGLRQARDALESRVGERTRELEAVNRELQRVVEELSKAEERYRTLVDVAPVAIHINCDGKIVFANSVAAKAIGADSPDKLIGRPLRDFLHPSLWEIAEQRTKKMLDEWQPAPVIEMHGNRIDGTLGWAEIHSSPIMYDGKPSILVVALDVTDRKEAEDQLRASLREKGVLLREVHHRVRNNLQVMSSLLALQGAYVQDSTSAQMFKDAQTRIWTMALVHETLYRSRDFGEIDSRTYLENLASTVLAAYGLAVGQVQAHMEIEEIPMGIDTALDCGMILNELLTNCLKHAFPQGTEGEIRVTLQKVGDKLVEMVIGDNGVGMPPNIDMRAPKSFGLDLVKTMADKLNAELELNTTEGTEFKIRFKV
ncbi:MAG: PAS domain S-box protein [Deltaproteobacteria bacterium]|nr:PAS domain S-box protein [Deltaproteobacteria bacterium]